MNDKDFCDLVAKMRQAQKDYFASRKRKDPWEVSKRYLDISRDIEKLVDIELTNKVEPSLF